MEPQYKKDQQPKEVNVEIQSDPISAITIARAALASSILKELSEPTKLTSDGLGALIDLISNRTKYDSVPVPNNERYLATKALETLLDYMTLRAKSSNPESLAACRYLVEVVTNLTANLASNL